MRVVVSDGSLPDFKPVGHRRCWTVEVATFVGAAGADSGCRVQDSWGPPGRLHDPVAADDDLGLVGVDRGAVDVADGVWQATVHDGPEPFCDFADDAQFAEVGLAAF